MTRGGISSRRDLSMRAAATRCREDLGADGVIAKRAGKAGYTKSARRPICVVTMVILWRFLANTMWLASTVEE